MDRLYAPWRSAYFTLAKGGECLFCAVQRETNDERVGILHRGKRWFVILNAFPYTSGHLMIVAARHVRRIGELNAEEAGELASLLPRCERAIEEEYRPDGINIGINIGESAGAGIVGHLHVHVCPRWRGDTNFMTTVAETRIVSEALEESWRRLRPRFSEADPSIPDTGG